MKRPATVTRQTLLTRADDNVGEGVFDSIAWALEVHVKVPDTSAYLMPGWAQASKFRSALLYGNEDSPDMINFYTEDEPLITSKPVYSWTRPE